MKAIDIVIIPPEPVMSEAIRVSGLVAGKHIRLNKGTQLPHISLLMGGMSPDRESEVLERIQKISGMFKSIPLSINEIRIKSSYTGLHLVRSDELFELHRTLVSDVMPLLDYAVPLHAVADADQALPKTLEWIQGFPENSSNENFDPHITLGRDWIPLNQ